MKRMAEAEALLAVRSPIHTPVEVAAKGTRATRRAGEGLHFREAVDFPGQESVAPWYEAGESGFVRTGPAPKRAAHKGRAREAKAWGGSHSPGWG